MKNLFKLQRYVGGYSKWLLIAECFNIYEMENVVAALNESAIADGQLYKLMSPEEYRQVSQIKYVGEELLKLLESNKRKNLDNVLV